MSQPRVLVSGRGELKLAPYLAALRAAGIDPVAVQPGHADSTKNSKGRVQGLVLTGGSDIDPRYYGQTPDPLVDGVADPERDAFEFELLEHAEHADLPILAICRGLQLLNVHRGGTLIRHLPQSERHRRRETPPSEPVHRVAIEQHSSLAAITGTNEILVNSRHHQAVGRLGAGLIITARDPHDQVIEALEDPAMRFLLAVQWHPEDQAPSDPVQKRLIDAFASACSV
jgi:putative glutamine amidotransferase